MFRNFVWSCILSLLKQAMPKVLNLKYIYLSLALKNQTILFSRKKVGSELLLKNELIVFL